MTGRKRLVSLALGLSAGAAFAASAQESLTLSPPAPAPSAHAGAGAVRDASRDVVESSPVVLERPGPIAIGLFDAGPAGEVRERASSHPLGREGEGAREGRATGYLIAGGLLGGAAGFFGGGPGGALLACDEANSENDLCAVGGFLVGATVGDSVLLPLGVHVANRTSGNYPLALLASLAIGGVGLGAAASTDNLVFLIPVPLAQLATSIAIERATS